jgi:subtilisin-like proprotein convertase family protein/subtilisin family serine protease
MLSAKMRIALWFPASVWVIASCSGLPAPTPDRPQVAEFHFRLPTEAIYRVETAPTARPMEPPVRWLQAWPADGAPNAVELGARVVVGLKPGTDVGAFLRHSSLPLARTIAPHLLILEAPDAWAAATEADRLARGAEVQACYPVLRRQFKKLGAYAPKPNDPFFGEQFYFENRSADGLPLGADLNARGAWPVTRGEGTVIAVTDDGIELSHPEFARRADGDLHFNFETYTTNALPVDAGDNHATAVAGLALAEFGNQAGIAGLAPLARPASWKIFTGDTFNVSDEGMMDLYQYRSNRVSVQNHSWGNPSVRPMGPTALEDHGISNAVTCGRQGRGVVLVRAGGNGRENGGDGNDDGWVNDPRSIAVAAVRQDGRAASYSSRGACLLVAAPGGDVDRGVFTTDRQGADGYNGDLGDNPDYAFDAGMRGTSYACPQVAGLAALMLAANPGLSYRDVQQILILASRPFDLQDPDLRSNGAGLLVSHNVGFGIPDAGEAVRLAQGWPSRPPLTNLAFKATGRWEIPDDSLRVAVTGTDVPPDLLPIPATPGSGPHPDAPTAVLPLVDIGQAASNLTVDLSGKAALIQRGGSTFEEQIGRAARAGAAFAVIYNNTGTYERTDMAGTDFVPIPAVMIGQDAGTGLQSLLQSDPAARARLELRSATCTFTVAETLICEHVRLRVRSDHARRGDLRITLLSPHGTLSVLQHINFDDFPGPVDWTYGSVQHFLESSAGTWTLAVTDEAPLDTGSVLEADLILCGVAITDTDHDGLDDAWELAHFGSQAPEPGDDPDGDGFNNAREQIMGTDPNRVDVAFRVDLSPWDESLARLSWPGVSNRIYQVLAGEEANSPLTVMTAVAGRFPETEWFTPRTNLARQFFRVQAAP